MAPTTLDAEVVANNINLYLANQQSLLDTLLPGRQKSDAQELARREEQIRIEEEELFSNPVPEWYGLGAKPPRDREAKREDLSSNHKLRKQLLSHDVLKKYNMTDRSRSKVGGNPATLGSKPRPMSSKRERADESDEEEDQGRSSLGKNKHHKKKKELKRVVEPTPDDAVDAIERDTTLDEHAHLPSKADTYMDQVLAEPPKKKRKKSKKKRQKLKLKQAAEASSSVT